ncbi:uncharacterized protein LOC122310380 [Carya illinoinensis]|uniref:uncharacterized protein LOC122310380 n=1 Tax=Carya illinoinensis TaxID=32201 RepID=UPI001C721491|nr:uncharacterized protein LOC122310380 [Carya illinoinensis]
MEVEDFGPISLVSKGRQILDSVLIANECLDHRCGFSNRWISSMLVNGTPDGFFNSSCGLRQGDPLSPILFVIVMKVLGQMVKAAVDGGFLASFPVSSDTNGSIIISHLFCDADPGHIQALHALLLCFEAVSGLGKSEMVAVGVVPRINRLTNLLGCKVSSLPMKYLGLPLGATFKVRAIGDGVIEKVEKMFAGWKRLYLSKVGRIAPIKSTLSNLSTYFLSLFPLPARVATRIEKLFWTFL